MKHTTRAAICLALAATGMQAHALYRCGSVYQDRPCDSSVEQKQLMKSGAVIVTPATPAPKPAAPAAPAAAPAKAAPAAAPAAVAAPAAPAAPAKPAAVATPPAPAAAPVAVAPPPATRQAAPAPSAAPAPAAAAAAAAVAAARSVPSGNSKARCALLGTQLDSVESKARAGGTAADMERYAQERRAVQKSLVDAGC